MTETDHDSHVFYITAQGYAGDHWYSWLVKALNVHPELFVFLANEGSRPKYFHERSRSKRPDLIRFTKFISDIGRIYQGVGDCYSYRAYQTAPLAENFGDRVRWVNVIRNPYAWLFFYVRWRCTNMRMGSLSSKPLDHEWNIVEHELYKDLRPYTKNDTEIWAFYRGLTFLNNHMVRDLAVPGTHTRLEQIVSSPDVFQQTVSYLTHDRVIFNDEQTDLIYSCLRQPFRGEEKVTLPVDAIRDSWQSWQTEAFEKLVSKEALKRYQTAGYELS